MSNSRKQPFATPKRPQVRVLRDLDLSVTSGQRIAIPMAQPRHCVDWK